jgi:O-antigen ligase
MNRAASASMHRTAPLRRSAGAGAGTITDVEKTKTPKTGAAAGTRVGLLPWVFPAMLALAALGVLLSGRDLAQAFLDLERETEGGAGAIVRHPMMPWAQRAVSLLLVAASIERIASHFLQRRPVPSPTLTWAFLFFWLTTVVTPAVFGAHPQISHEYAYSMLFGLAATLCSDADSDRIVAWSRDGLFLYMLAGMALVPVMPSLVLDTAYTQGLLPGLPRFGGLASHPVMMGMLTQTALLLLWTHPFARRWLNVAAWTLGLGVLFLAQSKTAWVAFVLSATILVIVRRTPEAVQRLGDPRRNSFGVLALFTCIAGVLALLGALLVADVPQLVADYFDTSEGAQLVSMTGRDRIWMVALGEWHNYPVFGYGPQLWDAEYRQAIAMPNATHGHNQFIDTLARCGTVGAAGLVVYALVLLVLSVRYARATRGLSLAMFTTLALQSVSEIPLLLAGYGTDVFTHILLVVVLAGAAAARPRPSPAKADPVEPRPLRSAR